MFDISVIEHFIYLRATGFYYANLSEYVTHL